MDWYFIVLIALTSIIVLYVIIDFILSIILLNIMIKPYCAPLEEVIASDIGYKKITKDEYENYYVTQEFDVKSKYGYNLKAFYIPKKIDVKFKDNKERVMIVCHGYTARHETMFMYAKIYLNLGFHVFLYDHRNHGVSDKAYTTLGDKEADDLQAVVEEVYKKMGHNIVLGTHGESMGSATVMIHAGRYHSVDFVCEDCGFHSLKDLLLYLCKYNKHAPTFPTLQFFNFLFKLVTKSSFEKSNPIKYVARCDDIPMYFIHGDKDDFVPSYMVYKCYDAKPGYKKVSIYDCDVHAHSIVRHYTEYAKNVEEFLKEINVVE